IKQPWQEYGQGLQCRDAYLVGRGTVGIGNELLAAYGLVRGGQAVRGLLRDRGTAGAILTATAEKKPGLGSLSGRQFRISSQDLATIERHLARPELDAADLAPENVAMIARLRTALTEGSLISGADASFYFHELTEAALMDQGIPYETAHLQALARYGVSHFSVYHPEVLQALGREHFNLNWFRFWGIEP
ncbi:MAG: hypothetical protein ACJ8CR_37630, partial [Roseiflexaceae bacterium]